MDDRKDDMEVRTAYCSACDRNVKVVVKPEAATGSGPRPFDPSDLACLEYGEMCTGDMCPLFDVPTDQMRENLNRLQEQSEPSPGSDHG